MPGAFHVMTKPVGPICNLDCSYCFYLEKEKLYPEQEPVGPVSRWAMPDAVLESYIRQYIEAQAVPTITFAWQGGEPTLLGVDYFRRVVELQRKHAAGKQIVNTLQTNGVLLDDPWCDFLAATEWLVGISVDGPRRLHDRYRVDKGGQPTFDKVMSGLRCLKKHGVEFNTLTVVQHDNSQHALEVYRFLKQAGSRFMQFIPVVERTSPTPGGLSLAAPDFQSAAAVTDWSVEAEQYGKFLCTIFDDWVRHDVGRYYVQIFDVALQSWCGLTPSLCVFRETCGEGLALEHNGDLYSCDHFVYPQYRLGNVMEHALGDMVRGQEQLKFGADKRDTLPQYCRECDVRFACNGECPKHRFIATPDGEAGLNYLCAAYKMFFQHVDGAMKFMAAELRAERPPANVMVWMRQQDGPAGKPAGKNVPCSCGSGRKFKRCCGK